MPTALIFRDGRLLPRQPRWPAQEFAESDYRHGSGSLRLRIVHIEWAGSVVRDGTTWLEAEAEELDAAGRSAGRRQVSSVRSDYRPRWHASDRDCGVTPSHPLEALR